MGLLPLGKLHYFNPFKSKTQECHLFPMWTWCEKMGLGMEAITRWQLRLHILPHARILKNLEHEQGDMQTPIE